MLLVKFMKHLVSLFDRIRMFGPGVTTNLVKQSWIIVEGNLFRMVWIWKFLSIDDLFRTKFDTCNLHVIMTQ